jgi:hypothetical protein
MRGKGVRAVLARIAVLAAGLLTAVPLPAAQSLHLRLGDIRREGLHIQDVQLDVGLGGKGPVEVHIRTGTIQLPEPIGTIHGVRVDCERARLGTLQLHCDEARIRLHSDLLDSPEFRASFTYRAVPRSLRLRIEGLHLAGGQLSLEGRFRERRWQATVRAGHLDAARIPPLLKRVAALGLPLEQWQGRLDFEADVSGSGGLPHSIEAHGKFQGLGFSDAGGLLAAEGLEGELRLSSRRRGGADHFDLGLSLRKGQLYADPVFLEPQPDAALAVRLRGARDVRRRRLDLDAIELVHPGVAALSGSARLRLGKTVELRSARLDLHELKFPAGYLTYLQPFLIGSAMDDLETEGSLSGTIGIGGQGIETVQLTLRDVYLDDHAGRFGLSALDGTLAWDAARERSSDVRWSGGHVFALEVGAARLHMQSRGRDLKLLTPLELPLFDGSLVVDELQLDNAGQPDMAVNLQGYLTPVSMERLSQALGWPVFRGRLSGMIPGVTYADGELAVHGNLLMRIFDGQVLIRGLRLADLFGPVPTLAADVDIRSLDLEPLTQAFSFGRIRGRLGGRIHGLVLEDWQPLAFDARLETPEDDDSRHEISQRAVENLSSLGGVSGALSRGLLRFFENFSYDRIGLGCRLRNGICEMDGVEAAPGGGYYIVKGGGLPRIHVVGFQRRVDWRVLMERIKNISLQGGPVVR